jgi:putative oxidoreductase
VAASAAAGAMAGAVSVHTPAGFFDQAGGFEYPAFLGSALAAATVVGTRAQDQPDEQPTDAAGE